MSVDVVHGTYEGTSARTPEQLTAPGARVRRSRSALHVSQSKKPHSPRRRQRFPAPGLAASTPAQSSSASSSRSMPKPTASQRRCRAPTRVRYGFP
jgi:hypothetical protein